MSKQPLAEVFGYPVDSMTDDAKRHRKKRLCPYNNKVANCTKDKKENPLGVCSVYDDGGVAITCPIRFREKWRMAEDAAEFFFGDDATWTCLTEVRLNDRNGKSAGNIDVVLVSYDGCGKILDFGALEVQAVYITGNVRRPFEHYMEDPGSRAAMDWSGESEYPRPDYLSSSRKRLAPQLMFKGEILNSWGRKIAVALNSAFLATLPKMDQVAKDEADIVWLIYDLQLDAVESRRVLKPACTMYTKFESSLQQITRPEIGPEDAFVGKLQARLRKKDH